MESGLSGKTVLVTGASGGIGSEVCRAFLKEGARVVAHYHRNRSGAEALGVTAIAADLRSESETAALFEKAGRVDVLVANSGIWPERDTPIVDMSFAQWRETISTNLDSMFLCFREFLKNVKRHGIEAPAGVMVGSTAGVFGEAGHGDYAASKAGATYGFLQTLKNEIVHLAPRGRVNAVCPSWILTGLADTLMKDTNLVKRTLQTVPLRRIGRPYEVANTIVFLASELASHISGQAIVLAGGKEGRVLWGPEEIDPARA